MILFWWEFGEGWPTSCFSRKLLLANRHFLSFSQNDNKSVVYKGVGTNPTILLMILLLSITHMHSSIILAVGAPQAPDFAVPAIVISIILFIVNRKVRGDSRTPVGAIVTALGVFLAVYAFIGMNRFMGASAEHYFALSAGLPATIFGIWMLASRKSR
ncbi:MAG: hypothetical protein NTY98_18495 [Verrucomicrobia bacterium]|nr:hypothetical protein [Verrucomicrobiota bacterium]